MKFDRQNKFSVWGFVAFIQIVVYAVCFTHLMPFVAHNPLLTTSAATNVVLMDLIGVSSWYGVHMFAERKDMKVIRYPFIALFLIGVVLVLFLNVRAWLG